MKQIFCLLVLIFIATLSYGQGSQKITGTSGTVKVDSAEIVKKLQADWDKYINDTLYKKETIKDFLDWFDSHLSHKDYQAEFSQKVLPYYNLWIQSKYNEWFLKRPKKE